MDSDCAVQVNKVLETPEVRVISVVARLQIVFRRGSLFTSGNESMITGIVMVSLHPSVENAMSVTSKVAGSEKI